MKKVFSCLIVFVVLVFMGNISVYGIEKTVDDLEYGVDGKVLLPSFYEKMRSDNEYESLIITSSSGIFVKYEGSLLHIDVIGTVKDLIVVDDINKDGVKDIVYVTNQADDFYNLVAVSGADASIIWKQKVSEEIYNTSAGFIDQNMSIYKIKKVNDNIAVIYDYDFVLYNLTDGKKVFHYEDDDNIWDITEINDINKDKTNDYVISNQLGELKAFNGKTNKIIWDSLITPQLKIYKDKSYLGKVTRNLWQVEYIGNDLYTIGEEGALYKVNSKNGKITNKLSIYEFDDALVNDYYRKTTYNPGKLYPISKNSLYYKMFEIVKLDEDRIIIKSFINKNTDTVEERIDITYDKPFFALVNLKDNKIEYKVVLNELEIYNSNILEMNNEFIIPLYIKDGKLILDSYDNKTGKELKKYQMTIGANYTNETVKNIYLNKYEDNILLESKNNFSYIVKIDLKTIVKNNDALSYSYVLSSNNKELVVYYKTNDIINKVVKYNDYSKNNVSFEYNVPTNFKNNGLSSISITQDFNKDGVKDLTALINKVNDKNEVVISYFLVLNMKTGKVISLKNIFLYSYKNEKNKKIDVYLTGSELSAVKDVNADNTPDLVLDGNIINGSKFKVMGSVNESVNEAGNIVKVGDVNKDGFADFVNVSETKASLYISKKSSNSVSYTKTNYKYSYNKALMNYEYHYKAPDINKDGINELIFIAKNDNGLQYYVVVSGSNLKVICSIDKEGITESNNYGFLNFDVNNDGYNEIYKTSNWGSTANVISGKTGEVLITFPIYKYEGDYYYDGGKTEGGYSGVILPFYEAVVDKSIILGEDLNDDGHKELFFLREEYYPKQKLTLEAYDVFNKNSTVLKAFEIDTHSQSEEGYYVYSEKDMMEYSKKLIKIQNSNLYIYRSSYLDKNVIYDVINEKEISGFSASVDEAYLNSDTILGVYNSKPVLIKYENEFDLKEKKEKYSTLKLNWEYSETGGMNIVKVYDNGKYIKSSYGDNIKVLLPVGEHSIFIESIDKWGKISNYSMKVNIEKGSGILILTSFASVAVILFILYLMLSTKIRRKAAIRRAS